MRFADLPEADETMRIDASPQDIWPHISDITMPVGVSEELIAVEWSSGDDPIPCVGRTFVGTNTNRHFGQWQTTSTVIECDEPHRFAWAVGEPERPNTTWRFTVDADGDGSRVTQWVRIGPGESGLTFAIGRMPDKEERVVERRVEDFRAAMRANLAAIKQRAEAG